MLGKTIYSNIKSSSRCEPGAVDEVPSTNTRVNVVRGLPPSVTLASRPSLTPALGTDNVHTQMELEGWCGVDGQTPLRGGRRTGFEGEARRQTTQERGWSTAIKDLVIALCPHITG